MRQFAPRFTAKHEPVVKRLATLLLVVLLAMVMLDIAPVILGTRTGAAMAIVALTALAALTGHALGGPHEGARTAVGVCAAARNPGLALMVATLNSAPTGVVATVFAYLVISAVALVPYTAFSRRRVRIAQRETAPKASGT